MARSHDPRAVHALALLERADSGAFTLPEAVLAARADLDRLRVAERKAAETWAPLAPGTVKDRLADAMLAGSSAGEQALEEAIAEIDRAEEAQRLAELRVDATRRAVEKAEEALISVIDNKRDEIIVEHLRPALRETLAEVETIAKTLGPTVNLTDPMTVLGNAKLGSAYLGLVEARRRYETIRAAQRHLLRGNLPEPRELALYRNAPEVYKAAGIEWRGRFQASRKPWPSEPLPYLVWLATDSVPEPWIPTPDEFKALALEILEATKPKPAPTLIG